MIKDTLKVVGIFLLVSILIFLGHKHHEQKFTKTFFAMDTYIKLTVYTDDKASCDSFFYEAEKFCKAFDDSLSISKENGIEKFNNNKIKYLGMGKFVKPVIEDAIDIYEKTNGVFDPTIGIYMREWDYFQNPDIIIPSEKRLTHLQKYIGIKHLRIKADTLYKDEDSVFIDLGGIAKGYAVDYMADMMKKYGIFKGIIDAGGDIKCVGTKPDEKPFIIGIKDPRNEGIIAKIAIEDKSVVTSGDYERYFIRDSIRYHHIINPSTGIPVRGIMSITVIGSSAEENDAYATAFFVMGKDAAIEFANKTKNIECIVIYEKNGEITIEASNGIKDKIM